MGFTFSWQSENQGFLSLDCSFLVKLSSVYQDVCMGTGLHGRVMFGIQCQGQNGISRWDLLLKRRVTQSKACPLSECWHPPLRNCMGIAPSYKHTGTEGHAGWPTGGRTWEAIIIASATKMRTPRMWNKAVRRLGTLSKLVKTNSIWPRGFK